LLFIAKAFVGYRKGAAVTIVRIMAMMASEKITLFFRFRKVKSLFGAFKSILMM
jgi:hypothetical protein